MNRNRHTRAIGRLPILSTALLAAGGLLWNGIWSAASAQTSSGTSSEVIVNYDVLNALSGQPAPYGSQGAQVGTQPKSQLVPGSAPGAYGAQPYTPYGTVPPGVAQPTPIAPRLAGALAAPPPGMPSSVLTTLGPDGRPITPFKLKKPGSGTQSAQKPKEEPAADSAAAMSDPAGADTQVAAVTPPAEPADVPAQVSMPEPAPQAPAPGENAEAAPAAPAVEVPAPPAEAATPAPETPAPEQPAEQQLAQEQPAQEPAAQESAAQEPAAQEQTAQEQTAQEQPAEQAPTETPPAEGDAAKTETTEKQPAEEAAAETPPVPDPGQPAPPVPQGGIRIVFPTELNEVPSEANAALDDLAAQMQADENMRIQIMCYASGTEDTESKARRKSLARCINIRQYLFKKDVRTTRMDVRALGLKFEGQPADRVDIVPANS